MKAITVSITITEGSRSINETCEIDWPESDYPRHTEDAVTDAALLAFRRARNASKWADVEDDGG